MILSLARGLAGLICVASTLAVRGASAADAIPGIVGEDDRRMITETGAPWSAIGQINIATYRRTNRCTGSLIARNLVVTAAHCVMDPWRREPYPLHQIHFVAGVKGSTWQGHATAKCLHFPPGYAYEGPAKILPSLPFQQVPPEAFLRDMVLIVLDADLDGIEPLALDDDVEAAGVSLVHASYPRDRRYALTGHFGCRLRAADDSLWFTDCDTQPASSGGPLLVEKEGRWTLAAVMVGAAGTSGTIAVPVSAWPGLAAPLTCP